VAVCFVIWPVGPAIAHGPDVVTPDTLWRSWSVDPLVWGLLLFALTLYGHGVRRLWTRAGGGRGVTYAAAVAFAIGAAVLTVALVSPLDALGGTLLSAHMAQHALLVAVAPPLLLLGRPGVVFAWAVPGRRRWLLASHTWRRITGVVEALSQPLPAAALHGLALWAWHAPAAFDAAAARNGVHALEHACFFGTALLFWRAILIAWSGRHVGPAVGATFATLMHSGLLGALITMAPRPLYAWYRERTQVWGLSALEDQQLAGLIMWVPMGLIYLAASLALASRLLAAPRAQPSRRTQVRHRVVLKSMIAVLSGCLGVRAGLSGDLRGQRPAESRGAGGGVALGIPTLTPHPDAGLTAVRLRDPGMLLRMFSSAPAAAASSMPRGSRAASERNRQSPRRRDCPVRQTAWPRCRSSPQAD
jgi:putative membrane protein